MRFVKLYRAAIGILAVPMAVMSFPASSSAQGTATRVMIRVAAHDAKLLGSAVGGARITVFDARMGSVLAQGIQEGGTGDTQKLVVEPRKRGESVYDSNGAAGFLAELDLKEPTQVRIEAEGPLDSPQATQRVSRTMYLVPGVDVLGEGVILEMYGLNVEILEPAKNPKDMAGQKIPVRARVTMLCGCPIESGGLWNADAYSVEARIVAPDGEILQQASMPFSGETSVFGGEILVPTEDPALLADQEEGVGLSLEVLAMDAAKANFGMARFRFDEIGRGQSSE